MSQDIRTMLRPSIRQSVRPSIRTWSRRQFLQRSAAALAGATLFPAGALARDERRIVILHTNDTHSRIDPFPMDGRRNEGLGGVARRSTLIERIRANNEHVLLLDSGDIFQGTPYFNVFKGEIEFKAMSAMRYDVTTIGNHDFDNGVDGLVSMMPHAEFEWVSANYDVSNTGLEARVKPYVIREMDGVRIGIFGLGIDFEGLVLPSLHAGVSYTDPVMAARRTCETLRERGCNLVVCLSHLGHRYSGEDRPDDVSLAQEVPDIDVILGGHTHTFLDRPVVFPRSGRTDALVNQVGFAGIRLGRLDFVFDRDRRPSRWYAANYPIDDRIA